MTCINDNKVLMVIFGKSKKAADYHCLQKYVFHSNYNMDISI